MGPVFLAKEGHIKPLGRHPPVRAVQVTFSRKRHGGLLCPLWKRGRSKWHCNHNKKAKRTKALPTKPKPQIPLAEVHRRSAESLHWLWPYRLYRTTSNAAYSSFGHEVVTQPLLASLPRRLVLALPRCRPSKPKMESRWPVGELLNQVGILEPRNDNVFPGGD